MEKRGGGKERDKRRGGKGAEAGEKQKEKRIEKGGGRGSRE